MQPRYNMDKLREDLNIGDYSLGKTIGQGDFGRVSLAIHHSTGDQVAVKVLEKAQFQGSSDSKRILREIQILKNIKHPSLIQLYDVVETRARIYLIMEYVPGGELFDYIVDNQGLSETEACLFFQQIIAGVEYLHNAGIAHRDIKPENVLLASSQQSSGDNTNRTARHRSASRGVLSPYSSSRRGPHRDPPAEPPPFCQRAKGKGDRARGAGSREGTGRVLGPRSGLGEAEVPAAPEDPSRLHPPRRSRPPEPLPAFRPRLAPRAFRQDGGLGGGCDQPGPGGFGRPCRQAAGTGKHHQGDL